MFQKMQICFFFLGLCCIQTVVYAQDNGDNDCNNEGFTFYNGSLILNNDRQSTSRVFQIQNVGGGTVTLNREVQNDPDMNAGWSSSIDGGQYSLLAMNQNNFAFRCMINNPPIEIGLTNCQRVLRVCAISPKNALGSFWISENKSLLETLRQLKSRRIIN